MRPLTWLWHAFRGPYECVETESTFNRQLFSWSYESFSIFVSYELRIYQYRFRKWFIPDNLTRHVIMYGETSGNPPANIIEALKKPVFLSLGPGKGNVNVSDAEAFRMSLFFNDVLASRAKIA